MHVKFFRAFSMPQKLWDIVLNLSINNTSIFDISRMLCSPFVRHRKFEENFTKVCVVYSVIKRIQWIKIRMKNFVLCASNEKI